MSYTVGSIVRLTTTVRDLDGAVTNTPTVTIAVTKPDGTALSPAPTVSNSGSGGIYTANVTPDTSGIWLYVWTASGSVVAVSPPGGQFEARASRQLVASMEEFKGHVRFTTVVDDGRLLDCLVAVTDVMEEMVGPVTPRTFTERHMVRGRVITPRRHPLVSVTSITPWQGTAWDTTQYEADTDLNLIYLATTYTRQLCTVVYEAGHDPWPGRLKLAGLIVAQHEWTVRNGNGGRPSPDMDALALVPGTGYLVPHRALELMRPSLRMLAA